MFKFLFVILIPFTIFGQIVSGSDTLNFMGYNKGVGLDIISGNKLIKNRVLQSDTYFFTCATSIDSGDLFVMDNIYYTCACPCRDGGGFGSSQPFYRAKGGISSLKISEPLTITDTSVFKKIDTIKVYNNNPCCYIPFVTLSNQDIYEGAFFLLNTINKKYVLIKVDFVDTTVTSTCGTMPHDFTILKGLAIEWYLQNNGSLDFSQMKLVRTINPVKRNKETTKIAYKIGFAHEALLNSAKTVYNLKGLKIDIQKQGNLRNLVIYK